MVMDDQHRRPALAPELQELQAQGFGIEGLRNTQSAIVSGDNNNDRETNSHNNVKEVTMNDQNQNTAPVAPATNGATEAAKQAQPVGIPVPVGTQTIKIEMPQAAPTTLKSFGIDLGKTAAKAIVCTAVALTGRYIYERATRPEMVAVES